MDEALLLTIKQLFEYGILGIVAVVGWGLAGWFLYRDHKKKEEISVEVKNKEDIICQKDKELTELRQELTKTVQDLSEKRLQDVKEMIEDYNDIATNTIQTLDKLTVALEVVKHHKG